MKETIVELAIESPTELRLFGETVSVFANWRKFSDESEPSRKTDDALDAGVPDLMVHSSYCDSGERKILTFSDRRAAAAFLQLWRSEKRRLI